MVAALAGVMAAAVVACESKALQPLGGAGAEGEAATRARATRARAMLRNRSVTPAWAT